MGAGFLQQLKATIHRNVLIKIRTKKYLFAELFMPLYFVGILALIQMSIPRTTYEPIPDRQPGAVLLPFKSSSQSVIAVAPNTTDVRNVISRAFETVSLRSIEYFDNESLLLDAYRDRPASYRFTAALVFNPNPLLNGTYSIYLPSGSLPSFSDKHVPGSNCRYHPFVVNTSAPCLANLYYEMGFAQLQALVDSALIQLSANTFKDQPTINLTLFPKDKFVAKMDLMRSLVPIYLVLAFSPFVTYVVMLIVGEKEKKIRECMKIMGLKDSVYWLSWLIVYSLFSVFLSLVTSVLLYVTSVLPNSNILLIFITLFLYGISVITLAYMVTPFFNQGKVAGTVCSLITTMFSCLYYLTVYVQGVNPIAFWLMCLISPTGLALGMDRAVQYDLLGEGINFSNMWEGSFPYAAVPIMLVVDIILYALLAYYLDNVIPGEYGTRRSPLFCFYPSFWRCNSGVGNLSKSTQNLVDDQSADCASIRSVAAANADIEPVPREMEGTAAIKILNLKKVFKENTTEPLAAVDGVDLSIYESEITALLGHNGAGKTTLLNILLGMIPPTSGTANVCGMHIHNYNDLSKIREMTGICPQQDVLFENLTPVEHLKFYGAIKGVPESALDEQVQTTLREVGLTDVLATRAGKLSGGQKRKLSVAIAVMGDPKIIILDEPTSGVDPYSRRNLWTYLQSKRAGRVILLTTHFMDEADILADRKAILTKGKLRCAGTSLFLKNKFGLGYHLVFVVDNHYNSQKIDTLVMSHVQNAKKAPVHGQELSYMLPLEEVEKFPTLLAAVDQAIKEGTYGIQSYGISMTTLEEVFLKLGEEGGEAILETEKTAVHELMKTRTLSRQMSDTHSLAGGDYTAIPLADRGANLRLNEATPYAQPLWHSLRAILKIRFLSILRLPKNIWATIGAPILFLCIGFLLLKNQTTLSNESSLSLTPTYYTDSDGYPPLLLNNQTKPVETNLTAAFKSQNIKVNVSNYEFSYLLSMEPHTYLLNEPSFTKDNHLVSVEAVYNDSDVHSLPTMISLLDNARLYMLGVKNFSIHVVARLFPSTELPVEFDGNSMGGALFIGMLFATIPISLVMDTIEDREKKIKHLLRVNGMTFGVYWSSFLICHLALMLISLFIMIVVVVAFQVQSLMNAGALSSLFITYLLFIPTGLVYYYVLAFLFNKQEQAEAAFPFLFLFIGFIPFMAVFVLDTVLPNSSIGSTLHYAFSFLFPLYTPYAIVTSIGKVYIVSQFQGKTPEVSDYYKDKVLVTMISCMFNLVLYSILLRVCDALSMGESVMSIFKKGQSYVVPIQNDDVIENEDTDVKEERQRVDSWTTNDDVPVVMVKSLRRVYDSTSTNGLLAKLKKAKSDNDDATPPKVAVRNLGLLIKSGEVFGLLGPNGAGKTTTLRIIVTDEKPTAGKVIVAGYDVISNLDEVFQSMGYCPQHDAQWKSITLKEHLECYAAIRGIPNNNIPIVVNQFMEGLRIEEHSNKKSKELSGGTQRKLSFGISMLGSSRIVLLDEPSTGMDPQSKRYLWDTILASFQGNRGAILTTHSMEEADVLCTRVGIMVKGALRCLGSTQHLKNKHGGGYILEVKLASSDDPTSSMLKLEEFVQSCFPRAEQQECFGGRVKYTIPQSSVHSLAKIFSDLEGGKESIGITDYSFSQTTLEQVFLEFARQQEEDS